MFGTRRRAVPTLRQLAALGAAAGHGDPAKPVSPWHTLRFGGCNLERVIAKRYARSTHTEILDEACLRADFVEGHPNGLRCESPHVIKHLMLHRQPPFW